MRLTWTDLLTDSYTADELQRWLLPWSSIIAGRVAPEFITKFGIWFLRRPEGHVEMLDVFTGEVTRVAKSHEQFMSQVNDSFWQEVYLLSELIFHLHQLGKVAGPSECYALAPHPALGGPNPLAGDTVDPRFVMVMDVGLWQNLCVQALFGQE